MNHFILTFCCLSLAACTTTDEPGTAVPPVGFSVSVDNPQTRYDSADQPASMGVFAYHTPGGNFNAASSIPNFMYNQEITRSGTDWSYKPVKYWPASGDKLSFFAYAPHADKMTGGDAFTLSSANTTAGYPAATFTNVSGKTDLLLATPLLNLDKSTSTEVRFTFGHALAKVSFYVKNGDATSGKKLHSFSLTAPKEGKYTFTNTKYDYTAVSGSATTSLSLFPATAGATTEIPANTTDKVSLGSLYIHPDAGTKFSLTYSINGSAANTITFTDVILPSVPVLTCGANVGYTITVNKDTYTIQAGNGTEWSQNSQSEVVYYSPDDLKLGDYYYSDGTHSDGGLRLINVTTNACILADPLPDPETGKTCVGLVFYAGKHPTDDCTYTAKDGSAMGTVNGYVVALDNLGSTTLSGSNGGWVRWTGGRYILAGASKETDDYRGYFNTYIIKSSAEAEGAWSGSIFVLPYQVLTSFQTNLSPESSSGWYMASAGQLKDVSKYRVALQTIMAKLSKSMTDGVYWTSTESGSETAYKIIDFNSDNGRASSDAKVRRNPTRPVLTF